MATPVPLCTHVKPSGATCGSPAVSGTALCYHHSAIKSALARVVPLDKVPYGAHAPIPFVFPEDRASLQINLFLLLNAFNEKRIDQRTATIMHRVLRAMSANLGAKLNEDRAEAPAPPASAPRTTPSATPGTASAPSTALTSAPNPAPVPAPSRSETPASNLSSSHHRPAPRPTQHRPLPPSSHGPINPSAAFSAAYTPPSAPTYPLNRSDRKFLGALSPEGQRIIAMFSSQPD